MTTQLKTNVSQSFWCVLSKTKGVCFDEAEISIGPCKNTKNKKSKKCQGCKSCNKISWLDQLFKGGIILPESSNKPLTVLITGPPGSGKTTAVFNVLVQLARHGVPFLVIEPAKTEYRALRMMSDHPDPDVRAMAADVRIYSPGNDGVSRFRFNPFDYPNGITLDEHISQVLACFEAAMPMGGPLLNSILTGGMMFGFGHWELLIILIIALIIFGAGKLPEIGAGLGKSIRSFKKGVAEVETDIKKGTEKIEA